MAELYDYQWLLQMLFAFIRGPVSAMLSG